MARTRAEALRALLAAAVLLGAPAAAVPVRGAMSPGWTPPAAGPPARAGPPRLALRGGAGASSSDTAAGEAGADGRPTAVDLTGDRGVLKLTTRPGTAGPAPVDRDEVFVLFNATIDSLDNSSTTYNGKNIAGVRFDSTSEGPGAGLPRSFQVGSGNTLAGWDLAVRNMTRGERATLFVHSDFAYGPRGHTMRSGVFIPPNATLKFEFELLRWNEKDLYNNGSVVVSYTKTPAEERPENDNHPEDADEVLVRYTGRYQDRIFTSSGASRVGLSLGYRGAPRLLFPGRSRWCGCAASLHPAARAAHGAHGRSYQGRALYRDALQRLCVRRRGTDGRAARGGASGAGELPTCWILHACLRARKQ